MTTLIEIQTQIKLSYFDLFEDADFCLNATFDSLKSQDSFFVFFDLVNLLDSPFQTTIYSFFIYNCSFQSINAHGFVNVSIESEMIVKDSKFEDINAACLFYLSNLRNRTLENILLINSQTSLFSGQSSSIPHYEHFYFINVTARNISVKYWVFFETYASVQGTTTDLIIRDSIFSQLSVDDSNPAIDYLIGISKCLYMMISNFTVEGVSNVKVFYFWGFPDFQNSVANVTFLTITSTNRNYLFEIKDIAFLIIENSLFTCTDPSETPSEEMIAVTAICYPDCYLIMRNCSFFNLKGAENGGALVLRYQNSKRILMIDCVFQNNGEKSSSFADIKFQMIESIFFEIGTNDPSLVFANYNLYCLDLQNTDSFTNEEDCLKWMENNGTIILKIDDQEFFNLTKFNEIIQIHGIHDCIFSNSYATSILLEENGLAFFQNVIFSKINSTLQSSIALIKSLTFWYSYNVSFEDCVSEVDGGAFNLDFGSNVFMYFNNFTNIYSKNRGGIFFVNEATIYVENCQIINSYAQSHGGIIFAQNSIINFTNLSVINSFSEFRGGSFYLETSILSLRSCNIVNSSNYLDGAVIYSINNGQFMIIDTKFEKCKTEQKGIVYIQSIPELISIFSNFECVENKATYGTCIYIEKGKIFVNSSRFVNNFGVDYVICGFPSFLEIECEIQNSLFSKNNVLQELYFQQANLKIMNVVFKKDLFIYHSISTQFSFLNLTNVLFDYNSTNFGNDFLYVISLYSSEGIFSNVKFVINSQLAKIGCVLSDRSNLFMDSISFLNCQNYKGGAIQLISFSQLNLTSSIFYQNIASINGGCIYSFNSNLKIEKTNFSNNEASMEGSDIFILNEQEDKSSFLEIYDSNFSDFKIISVCIKLVSYVQILNNAYSQSTEMNSDVQAINLLNPDEFIISNSNFNNIHGQSSLSILTSGKMFFSGIKINKSRFFNCSSKNSGGAIFLKGLLNITILGCEFNLNNAGESGGAIFLDSQTKNSIIFNIENNKFINNSAKIYAGAIKLMSNFKDIETQNLFEGNKALIGNNFVTQAAKMLISTSPAQIFNLTNIFSLNVNSGQIFQLYVFVFDELDNFLVFENFSEVKIEIDENFKIERLKYNNFIIMNNRNFVENGISNFKSLLIIGEPGQSYQTLLSYKDQYNNIFSSNMRILINYCKKGEIYWNFKCIICGAGFYSLDENSYKHAKSTCDVCPENAKCMGSFYILPSKGYWKLNEQSILMIKCFYEDSCLDQTSFFEQNPVNYSYQCSQGSYGNLCYNCLQGFTKNSDGICVNCSKDSLSYVKFFVLFFGSMLFLTYQTIVALKMTENSSKKRSLLKIIINHNYYMNFMENLKDALVGNFKEFYIFSNQYVASVPEFNFDCFLTESVNPNSLQIAKIFSFSIFPLFVIILIFIIRFVAYSAYLVVKRKKNQEENKIKMKLILGSSIIVTIYNYYSRLIANTFRLLKCINLDQTSLTFLEIDPNIMCWETGGTHLYLLKTLFLPNLFIWCIGWPLFLVILLFFHNSKGLKQLRKKLAQTKRNSSFSKILNLPSVLLSRSVEGPKAYNMAKNNESCQRMLHVNNLPMNNYAEKTGSILLSSIQKKKIGNTNDLPKKSKLLEPDFLLDSQLKKKIFEKKKLLRFLTIDYRADYYFWEGFFYSTNLIIASINVSTSRFNISSKGAIYVALYFSMLLMNQNFKPFKFNIVNKLASYSYMISLITVGLVVMSSSNSGLYFFLIMVLNSFFYVSWIFVFGMIVIKDNQKFLNFLTEKLWRLKNKALKKFF